MTKEFSGLVSTELKLFSREPMLIFVIFIRPAILLFLIMEFIIPAGNIPKDVAINEVVPAIIILNVAMVAIFNIPASAASYREIKFFKRLRATPVSSLTILSISGIFIPLEMLPDWIVDYIAPLVPATYAVKLLQGLWVGKPLLDFSREIILLSVFFIAI